MIKTKSIYRDPVEPEDAYRLLVMRRWPRGVRKTQINGWIKELGPSTETLNDLRNGSIDWPTFESCYLAEVSARSAEQGLLEEVRRIENEHGTVTLPCYEDLSNTNAHCHREVLREMLEVEQP